MANDIVAVNVSVQSAGIPSTLQGTGAMVTQGGTSTADGTITLVSDMDELDAIIAIPLAATFAWSANVVTATTSAPHGIATGAVIPVTIAGATPTGYNGHFSATRTGASTFTYPLTPNPGAATAAGTWVPDAAAELRAMGETFFAQGDAVSVNVLELGADDVVDGIAGLDSYIDDNPDTIYSWMVPEDFADSTTMGALADQFSDPTGKTYFFITADATNYAEFEDIKSVFALIPSPDESALAFPTAAPFYSTLSNAPSSAVKVPPTAFRYMYGVTAYAPAGNASLFATYKAAGLNWIGTGGEGGISDEVLFWGTVMGDPSGVKRDFGYWYAIDWTQINLKRDLANAIINGSNTSVNPLYYNQDGINRLRARAQQTVNLGISAGLILGPATVQAIPFATYVAANPTHYASGIYNGLSVTISVQNGFKSITFGLEVSDFAVAA